MGDNAQGGHHHPRIQPGHIEQLPYTEWGKKEWEAYDANKNGDYAVAAFRSVSPAPFTGPIPRRSFRTTTTWFSFSSKTRCSHIVPTDGRGFTPELPPSWFGESIGRWDGDTLVVETRNLNGYAKLDTSGHPISNQIRITQTFKRVNFGTIEHTFTVDDPKTYTRPFTIRDTWPMEKWGTVLMEYACMEGNIDGLLSGAITPWKPPADDQ